MLVLSWTFYILWPNLANDFKKGLCILVQIETLFFFASCLCRATEKCAPMTGFQLQEYEDLILVALPHERWFRNDLNAALGGFASSNREHQQRIFAI